VSVKKLDLKETRRAIEEKATDKALEFLYEVCAEKANFPENLLVEE